MEGGGCLHLSREQFDWFVSFFVVFGFYTIFSGGGGFDAVLTDSSPMRSSLSPTASSVQYLHMRVSL